MDMVTGFKWLCCLALLSTSVQADINFQYHPVNKSITVTGNLCEYGRASKKNLPELTLAAIHQHLLTKELDFVEQVKDINSGMAGHRLELAKLALIYQLTPTSIDYDYYFEGNQSCANYQADLMLDFDKAYEDYIELIAPDNYSFVSSTDNSSIFTKLRHVYPGLDIDVIDAEQLVKVQDISTELALFQFDYLSYSTSNAISKSGFFVSGENLLAQALSDYLIGYGFTLKSSQEEAYWLLAIEQTSNKELKVSYNHQDQASQSVRSEGTYGLMTADTEQEQLQLFTLQLELMELVEKLK